LGLSLLSFSSTAFYPLSLAWVHPLDFMHALGERMNYLSHFLSGYSITAMLLAEILAEQQPLAL